MKKDYKNKMVEPGEESTKASAKKFSLLCIRGCDMPGVGCWKSGEIIDKPEVIARIGDNPNFVKNEEVR